MNKRSLLCPMTSLLLVLAAGCAPGTAAEAGDAEEVADNVLSFEEYLEMAVSRHDPISDTYIVEGDIMLHGIEAVREHYKRSMAPSGALTTWGSISYGTWDSTEKMSLTYCIDQASFGSRFNAIVAALDAATAEWEAAADVGFIYVPGQNGACTSSNESVVFNVVYGGSGVDCKEWEGIPYECGTTYATSFFPFDDREDRVLTVYKEAFTEKNTAAVMKHELGHSLGFVHEHVWIGCGGESSSDAVALTPYDETSVMAYQWCTNQSGEDKITPMDVQGAQVVYGASTFAVLRPTGYDDFKGDQTNVYVGDFNNDGRDDLLRQEKATWDNDSTNTASVWLSNGDGSYQKVPLPESYKLNGDTTNLYIGDFNYDHRSDFLRQEKGAWDDDSTGTADIFLATATAGVFTKVSLPESYKLNGDTTNLYIGDFNYDHKSDFLRQEKGAWDNDGSGTAHLFLATATDGVFTKVSLPESYKLNGDTTNLYIGDFNGDHRSDFLRQEKGVWDDDSTNTFNVFYSQGDGTFTKVTPSGFDQLKGDWNKVIVGDFDYNGKDDFIRQKTGGWDEDSYPAMNIWFSDDDDDSFNVVTPSEADQLRGDRTVLTPGDFNDDDRVDFLRQEIGAWANDNDNTCTVWLSGGDGTFTIVLPPADWSFDGERSSVVVGNFNDDEKADLFRREHGAWDDDDRHTAQTFFSAL